MERGLVIVFSTAKSFAQIVEELKSLGGAKPELQIASIQVPNEEELKNILDTAQKIISDKKRRSN